AWVADKFGRLKMRRDQGDGLGTFEALEFLELGIHGKWALWRALAAVSDEDDRLKGVDYAHLTSRAEAQRNTVEERRLDIARAALLGKRIEDISYDVHAVPLLFAQFLETGAQTGEYVLQRRDCTPLPIHYRAFLFSDGCHAAIWDPVGGWKELYLAALLEIDP